MFVVQEVVKIRPDLRVAAKPKLLSTVSMSENLAKDRRGGCKQLFQHGAPVRDDAASSGEMFLGF